MDTEETYKDIKAIEKTLEGSSIIDDPPSCIDLKEEKFREKFSQLEIRFRNLNKHTVI